MLFGFSTLMFIIILFEVGVSIYAYDQRNQLDSFVGNSLNNALRNVKDDSALYAPWHLLQYEVRIQWAHFLTFPTLINLIVLVRMLWNQ